MTRFLHKFLSNDLAEEMDDLHVEHNMTVNFPGGQHTQILTESTLAYIVLEITISLVTNADLIVIKNSQNGSFRNDSQPHYDDTDSICIERVNLAYLTKTFLCPPMTESISAEILIIGLTQTITETVSTCVSENEIII